ncbi:MAG TPA: hypothetical protein VI141_05780 [Acidimicrobiia bacterium]
MTSSLASRLGDIPGVASVAIDLEGFGRGIDVRLEPGADEVEVMERLRALLAAYGIKGERDPAPVVRPRAARQDHPVVIGIAPIKNGARIEVATRTVKSFRIVAANPLSIAQGLADAWCQVIGRVPIEIIRVEIDVEGTLVVVGSDGDRETTGSASVDGGWVEALTLAVGGVLGDSAVSDVARAAS